MRNKAKKPTAENSPSTFTFRDIVSLSTTELPPPTESSGAQQSGGAAQQVAPEADGDEAGSLKAALDASPLRDASPRCPRCGSDDVRSRHVVTIKSADFAKAEIWGSRADDRTGLDRARCFNCHEEWDYEA
ncbi:unnamed protein product [Amoebophrya sp. A25]|nr:unnamed protein product [Amoebophrya sp. A25]|eukprot:GSA25T00018906001.1